MLEFFFSARIYGNYHRFEVSGEARARALRDSTEDRRIGLNMNYSIIFTEISFSPETSILLQIIQIIHMTIGIMPESDRKREGSLSVLAPRRQTQCYSHR